MQVGHAGSFQVALDLALVVNVGLGQFVLEKSLLAVPGFFRRAVGETRQIFLIRNRFGIAAAALRWRGEQREVETLNRLAAFIGQLSADAAFIFEAGNLMAARAAIMPHPFLAFLFQRGIIHECGVCIR